MSSAFFSNYGATTVDLAAPGEDIFSCWGGSNTDYRFDSGTSMAAAHVSGAAALVWAHAPAATYAAVKQSILSGTDSLPGLQGKCVTGGRLNLSRALAVVPPPPAPPLPPSNLTATATSSSAINLTWSDNADSEQGFAVERSTDNATFTQIATPGANATSYSDAGLAASTTYYYRVRAFNAAGNSPYSNTASATTQASPPPPTLPTVTVLATDVTASESGDTGEFTLRRTGDMSAPLIVRYSIGGTATNGIDYRTLPGFVTIPAGASSVNIKVVPIDDNVIELEETVIVSISAEASYQTGPLNIATVVILDNDLLPLPLL